MDRPIPHKESQLQDQAPHIRTPKTTYPNPQSLTVNNDLLFKSIHAFKQNWELTLSIIACVAWGSLLVFTFLKKIDGKHYSDIEITALALGGWPIPVLLISLLIIFLNTFFSLKYTFILTLLFIICSAGLAIRFLWNKTSPNILPFIFITFTFMHLGFAANIILPTYFDSAEHYRIIQSLLDTNAIFPTTSYYHIGYHIICAAITLITHQNISQVMLLFGQVVLAAIPLPIYFFILRITGSHRAALFSVILAAFGWFMPSYAVNWGKYPALLSLLTIQFALGMALIENRWLFTLSLIMSVLIHSRSFILITIIMGAWTLSTIWIRQSRYKRVLLFGLIGALLVLAILLIKQDPVLRPILEPYQIWVTLLIGLVSALVFQSFPQQIFFSTLSILLMLAGMFIPITPAITLLDRPLIEMTLFLPITFLGGLGITRIPKFTMIIITAYIIVHAWMIYGFSTSSCCQLAGRDDAVALDWIDKNLPIDAHIAIASAELDINSFGVPMENTGTDAGIWVNPLTQRTVLYLPYSIEFINQNTYAFLCNMHVTHIYIGTRPQSFNSDFITIKPAWYETVLFLPNTQIVHVLSC